MPPESEEAFIAEHYWGYAVQRDGSTLEYRVEHPPWYVADTTEARLDCNVSALYGAKYADILEGPPRSAFLATGSEVTVYGGSRLSS